MSDRSSFTGSQASILSLPDSLLLRIFAYVNYNDLCLGIRLVSRLWNQLSYDFSFWRDLKLAHRQYLTDDEFMKILDGCHHIIGVNVKHCTNLTDRSFIHIAESCPDLEKLIVSGTKISDEALLDIARQCPKIRELEIYSCKVLTVNSLESLLCLQDLRCFRINESISWVVNDQYRSLIAIEDSDHMLPSQLEEFTIASYCWWLVNDEWLTGLPQRWVRLRVLNVGGCVTLADASIVSFAEHCPNLHTVILNLCQVGDKALKALATHCLGLQHLNVSCCRRITDVGISDVAMKCSQLKYLDVSGSQADEYEHLVDVNSQGNATDTAIQDIAENCPQLTYLNVSSCPGVTDIGLVAISEHCHQLQHLEMTACISITDKTVLAITKNCRHFEHLVASECVQLTSRSVNALVKFCPRLLNVQLETCHYMAQLNFDPPTETFSRYDESGNIMSIEDCNLASSADNNQCSASEHDNRTRHSTSKGQETMLSNLPTALLQYSIGSRALKHLNLSCCSKIANDSLRQISNHCKYLQFISLYGCYRITDKGIEYLVKGCPHLQYINLECLRMHRSKLTDLTLLDIAENCQNLKSLNIRGAVQFSKEYISIVVNSCHKLTKLRCTMEVRGDIYQDLFLPREPFKSVLEGQLSWSLKYHPHYGNPVKQCHLLFKFRPSTPSRR